VRTHCGGPSFPKQNGRNVKKDPRDIFYGRAILDLVDLYSHKAHSPTAMSEYFRQSASPTKSGDNLSRDKTPNVSPKVCGTIFMCDPPNVEIFLPNKYSNPSE